ncbi:hypothetical protein ACFPRL_00625 [Pseudoclavibacter helvolus]
MRSRSESSPSLPISSARSRRRRKRSAPPKSFRSAQRLGQRKKLKRTADLAALSKLRRLLSWSGPRSSLPQTGTHLT